MNLNVTWHLTTGIEALTALETPFRQSTFPTAVPDYTRLQYEPSVQPPLGNPLLIMTRPTDRTGKTRRIDFVSLTEKFQGRWEKALKSNVFVGETLVTEVGKELGYDLGRLKLSHTEARELYLNIHALFSLCLILPDLDDDGRDKTIQKVIQNYPSIREFPPFNKFLAHIGYLSEEAGSYWKAAFASMGSPNP